LRPAAVSAAAVACFLIAASSSRAQQVVHHPQDGYATIQEAVDSAGCGGTVKLAPGVYNERVFAGCGIRLVGAGVGRTTLHDTGLEFLEGGLVNLGGVPFAVFPFTSGYEVAHMTIRSGPEPASVLGIGVGWTRGLRVHDVEVSGFTVGIGLAVSTASTIERVHVEGPAGPPTFPLTKCVQFVEFGFFLTELPHMSGHTVRSSNLESCALGVDLQNATDSSIAFNRIRASLVGISVFGGSRLSMHHNFIAHSTFVGAPFVAAGIDPSNIQDSDIHRNVICDNTVGVHFSFNQTPDAFGFLPSSNNRIHHNLFGSNGEDVAFTAIDIGERNRVFANRSSAHLPCP
jgi:hypothetical protein